MIGDPYEGIGFSQSESDHRIKGKLKQLTKGGYHSGASVRPCLSESFINEAAHQKYPFLPSKNNDLQSVHDRRVEIFDPAKIWKLQQDYLNRKDREGDWLDEEDHKKLWQKLNSLHKWEYLLILQVAMHHDDNDEYYRQLDNFELPDCLPSMVPATQSKLLRALHSKDKEFIYDLVSLAEGRSRLLEHFGVFFCPSSIWMGVVAEKLKSLGCKKGLEVMAGNGLLSYFLNKHYMFEMITSDKSGHRQALVSGTGDVLQPYVLKETALSSIRKYKECVQFLVISWPIGDEVQGNCVIMRSRDTDIVNQWNGKGPIFFIGTRKPYGNAWLIGSAEFHKTLNELYDAEVITEYQRV